MSARATPLRDAAMILRAGVVPFVIGFGGLAIGIWGAEASNRTDDFGPENAIIKVWLFALVGVLIAGALAGAVSGRGRGVLGFAAAMAGVTTGIVAGFLTSSGDAFLEHLDDVPVYFVPALVALAIGYAPAHALADMIAGPRQEPVRWGAAPPVAPWGPGPSWPTAPGQTDGGEDAKGLPQDGNQAGPTR